MQQEHSETGAYEEPYGDGSETGAGDRKAHPAVRQVPSRYMAGPSLGKVSCQDATSRLVPDQQRLVGRGNVSSSALMNALKLPLSARGSRSIHLHTSSKEAAHSFDSPRLLDQTVTHPPGSLHAPIHSAFESSLQHQQIHNPAISNNYFGQNSSDYAPDASNFHDQSQHRGAQPSSNLHHAYVGTAPLSARAPRNPPQQAAPLSNQHPSTSNGSSSGGSSSVHDYSSQLHSLHHNLHASTAADTQAAANAAAMEARKEQLRTFQQQKLSARSGSVFRSTQPSRLSSTDDATQARDSQSMPPPPSRTPHPLIPKLSLGILAQPALHDQALDSASSRSEQASLSNPATNPGISSARPSRPPVAASTHNAPKPSSSTAAASVARQPQPQFMMLPTPLHVTPRMPPPAWEGVRPIVSNRRMSVGGQMLEEPARRAAQVPLPDMGDHSAFSTPRTARGRVQSSGIGVITKSPAPPSKHTHHLEQNSTPWSPSMPANPHSSSRPHAHQAAQSHLHPTHSLSSTPIVITNTNMNGNINNVNHTSNSNNHASYKASSTVDPNNSSLHSSHSSIGGTSATASLVASTPRRAGTAAQASSIGTGEELRSLRMQQLQWMVLNAKVEAATKARTQEAEQSLAALTMMNAHLRHSVSMGNALLSRRAAAARLSRVLTEQGPLIQQWASVQAEHRSATRSIMTALQDTLVNVPLTNGAHISGDRAGVVAQLREPMDAALQALRSAETALSQLLACESAASAFKTQAGMAETRLANSSSTAHVGAVTLRMPAMTSGVPAVTTAEAQSVSGVLRSTQLLSELSSTVAQELGLLLEVVGQVSRLSDVQLQMHSTVAHMLQLGREQP